MKEKLLNFFNINFVIYDKWYIGLWVDVHFVNVNIINIST